MTLSIINNNDQTMSSVEIAELTGKRHDNVLTDIRKMLVEIQSPEKAGDYKDGRGRTQPCLLLTKDESLCLVAGYSATLRMAIIKRWQELEAKQTPQIPQTYAAALLEAVVWLWNWIRQRQQSPFRHQSPILLIVLQVTIRA